MQQNSTCLGAAFAVFALLILFQSTGCGDSSCREIGGRWSTREGQTIDFRKNGKALWFTRFGSQVDTVGMKYRYDCQKQYTELDLYGFQSGPLTGKTLFGILEWNSDTSFRYNAEAGTDPAVRPQTFESDQTLKFFRDPGNGGKRR